MTLYPAVVNMPPRMSGEPDDDSSEVKSVAYTTDQMDILANPTVNPPPSIEDTCATSGKLMYVY